MAMAAASSSSLKRVAIFGASGQIGLKATEAALNNGCKVVALLRDPGKLPENLRNQVTVVQGDVTNQDDVKKTVAGQDAVIVTLGTRNDLSPTTVMSNGMRNIVDAMKENNVELVSICLSGFYLEKVFPYVAAFLFYEPEKVPKIFTELNADHERMYNCLKESGLKWIAVFPPHFTDDPSSKVTVAHGSSPGRTISKHDLGTFMLECLSQPEHYGKTVGIANVK